MADLRLRFEGLGFANVATFIASGNVIFDAVEGEPAELQARIEGHLRAALGYEVATFLRTPHELAAIATYAPFVDSSLNGDGATLSIMFLAATPDADLHERLRAFETPIDALHVHGREIYWLSQGRTTDSLIDWPLLGKTVRLPLTTVRNATTVRKLAAKYPPIP
jgi:uncharacterized protein (DUF1697 family)